MCGVRADATVKATGRSASRRGRRPTGRGQPAPAGGFSVGAQYLGERLAVPVLLVAPARQEGGDLGVSVGAGGQKVAQVAGGVPLHVVHVAEAAQGVAVERLAAEGAEVDVVGLEAPRAPDQGVDVGGHGSSSVQGRPADVSVEGSGPVARLPGAGMPPCPGPGPALPSRGGEPVIQGDGRLRRTGRHAQARDGQRRRLDGGDRPHARAGTGRGLPSSRRGGVRPGPTRAWDLPTWPRRSPRRSSSTCGTHRSASTPAGAPCGPS